MLISLISGQLPAAVSSLLARVRSFTLLVLFRLTNSKHTALQRINDDFILTVQNKWKYSPNVGFLFLGSNCISCMESRIIKHVSLSTWYTGLIHAAYLFSKNCRTPVFVLLRGVPSVSHHNVGSSWTWDPTWYTKTILSEGLHGKTPKQIFEQKNV